MKNGWVHSLLLHISSKVIMVSDLLNRLSFSCHLQHPTQSLCNPSIMPFLSSLTITTTSSGRPRWKMYFSPMALKSSSKEPSHAHPRNYPREKSTLNLCSGGVSIEWFLAGCIPLLHQASWAKSLGTKHPMMLGWLYKGSFLLQAKPVLCSFALSSKRPRKELILC